jgi:lactoylglutathione lyase
MYKKLAGLIALGLFACASGAPLDEPTHPQTSAMPVTKTRLGFFSIKVADLERSLNFYTNVVGMTERRRLNAGNGVTQALLGFGETSSQPGLMLTHNAKHPRAYEHPAEQLSRFVFYVADWRDMMKKLKEAGAEITQGPTHADAQHMTLLLAKDPDGYLIEFIQKDPQSPPVANKAAP